MRKPMDAIAIVGMGCLVPGSKTPECFYRALLDNKGHVADAVLPDIDAADFAGMALPALYDSLDSVFLHTLYVARQALVSSGYHDSPEVLRRTGMIMGARETCSPKIFDLFGAAYLDELEHCIRELLVDERFSFPQTGDNETGSPFNAFHFSYPTLLAGKTLGMAGPAFALDAACASSLYSIKLAAGYLTSGAADMMLAGGFTSGFKEEALQHYFASLGVAAKAGASWPLDRSSTGMAARDGGGVVVLKRLQDAERDQDTILAVINSIGWWNESGKGKLVLAPSKSGQASTYKDAFDVVSDSRITPANIDFVECHATGTPVGDTIELNTLDAFFERHQSQPLFGSVKGNIGHLLAGAGVAALIKIICSMREGIIPATRNAGNPLASRRRRFSADNMVICNTRWPHCDDSQHIRRAAINCFGFGGAHAHMILSQYRAGDSGAPAFSDRADVSLNVRKPLALIGAGVQVGEITGLAAFIAALKNPDSISASANRRLRGIDSRISATEPFIPADAFAPGLSCASLQVDFLKSGVNPESRGEALNKELMLLNVVDQALIQAGFRRGKSQRVGVIVAARQNLFQVQLYLEYYLPRWIDDALRQNGIVLDDERKATVITLATDAILHAGNDGFDFVATGIGPIVASRISAAWGFTGPTLKLCSLETSTLRSLELAEQMLRLDGLEAVVVAVADNDPALESRILLRKYGQQLGLRLSRRLIDDSAVAFVVTSQKVLQSASKPVLAYLSDVVVDIDTLSGKNPAAVGLGSSCFSQETYGSGAWQNENSDAMCSTQPDGINDTLGFSLSTSAALSIIKAMNNGHYATSGTNYCSTQPVLVQGFGFDGQYGQLHVTAADAGLSETHSTWVERSGPDADILVDKHGGERSLVKTVFHELPTLRSIVRSSSTACDSDSNFIEIPVQPANAPESVGNAMQADYSTAFLAQLFQQNCQIQNTYYENHNLLAQLAGDTLATSDWKSISTGSSSQRDGDHELRN